MKILLTNDDGHSSAGFYPLLRELSKEFEVTTIVPHKENSWVGKKISPDEDIEVKKIKLGEFEIYSCTGTPADCVQIGCYHLDRPNIVVAGINIGENIGSFAYSSGTVGAAIEAALDGLRGVAFSMHVPKKYRKKNFLMSSEAYPLFENAAKIAAKIIKKIIDKKFDQSFHVLNVNIHIDSTVDSEIVVTKPLFLPYKQLFFKKEGVYRHKWKEIYEKHYAGEEETDPSTDIGAMARKKISITPMTINFTEDKAIEKVKEILNDW